MEIETRREKKVLVLLLKDVSVRHTITSLSKQFKISRPGIWKLLKRLEAQQIIKLIPVGSGKTSTFLIGLDWNILTKKMLMLYLAEESLNQARWRSNFEELEKNVRFLILYGSVLHSPQQANDIDLVSVAEKQNFKKIQNSLDKIQKSQIKKVHALNFTETEFREELKSNKIFIEAVKKGVILFGQEDFITFIERYLHE